MAEISLEVTGVDNMFDAMPVSVYDLMGMGRGAFANMAIATTQTNDDSRETEVQTEEVR